MEVVTRENISQVLTTLSSKEINKGINKALKKIGALVQKEAKGELKRKVKITGKSYNSRKYGKMDKGIKTSVDGDEVKIHIMGDYRLKFIEAGTVSRKTKKGWNRGTMPTKPFFKPAVQTVQQDVNELFNIEFENTVTRILAKQNKI